MRVLKRAVLVKRRLRPGKNNAKKRGIRLDKHKRKLIIMCKKITEGPW